MNELRRIKIAGNMDHICDTYPESFIELSLMVKHFENEKQKLVF